MLEGALYVLSGGGAASRVMSALMALNLLAFSRWRAPLPVAENRTFMAKRSSAALDQAAGLRRQPHPRRQFAIDPGRSRVSLEDGVPLANRAMGLQ